MARKRRNPPRRKRPTRLVYPSLNVEIPPDSLDVEFQYDGYNVNEDDPTLYGATEFPDSLLIDRSELDDRIRENDKHKNWAIDYSLRWTHQGRSDECVSHACIQCMEITYARQVGKKNGLYLSPLSIYTRENPNRYGGANVNSMVQRAKREGVLPEHDGIKGKDAQRKLFKHTLHQTSGRTSEPGGGRWVRREDLPEGWRDTARHFRILEMYAIRGPSQFLSALAQGWAIINGRDGHSICHGAVVKRDRGDYASKILDSYNRFIFDSENKLRSGIAIRSVNMPSDVSNPAGEDGRNEND